MGIVASVYNTLKALKIEYRVELRLSVSAGLLRAGLLARCFRRMPVHARASVRGGSQCDATFDAALFLARAYLLESDLPVGLPCSSMSPGDASTRVGGWMCARVHAITQRAMPASTAPLRCRHRHPTSSRSKGPELKTRVAVRLQRVDHQLQLPHAVYAGS
jgi:hypothetical protein